MAQTTSIIMHIVHVQYSLALYKLSKLLPMVLLEMHIGNSECFKLQQT